MGSERHEIKANVMRSADEPGSEVVTLIELPVRSNPTGSLCFAQESVEIPFRVRRVFYLYELAPDSVRGQHAHRQQHQFLTMVSGACTVIIDDGNECWSVKLDRPSLALYVPPMYWLKLHQFSRGSVCAVLTSGLYEEADYIREYSEFRDLADSVRSSED